MYLRKQPINPLPAFHNNTLDKLKQTMKVIVCGCRAYENEAFIWIKLNALHEERPFTAIMQGGAKGVDKIVRQWASSRSKIVRYVCHADWKLHGKRAGPIRNARMLEWKPDLVVAFPLPESVGTWDMVKKAKDAGVEVIVYE